MCGKTFHPIPILACLLVLLSGGMNLSAAPENNPPKCPPHDWGDPVEEETNCSISLSATQSKTLRIGEETTIAAESSGSPGSTDTVKYCKRCGERQLISTVQHSVSYSWSASGPNGFSASGDGLSATFTPDKAGTGTATFKAVCDKEGDLATASATYTVVKVVSITPKAPAVGFGIQLTPNDYTVETYPEGHEDMVLISPVNTSHTGKQNASAICGTSSATCEQVVVAVDSISEPVELPLDIGGDAYLEVISAGTEPMGYQNMISWNEGGQGGSILAMIPADKVATYTFEASCGLSKKITTVKVTAGSVTSSSSARNHNIDIRGLPVPQKAPQQEEETDQPSSRFSVNAGDLTPSYSITDISVPVGNGDLRLEFRRSCGMTRRDGFNLNSMSSVGGPGYEHPLVLGRAWTTNILAIAQVVGIGINTDPNIPPTSVVLWDEDGAEFHYLNGKPVIRSLSDAAASQTSVSFQDGKLLWTKKHGTIYTFSKNVWADTDNVSKVFLLESVSDRNGNTIRYHYPDGSRLPDKIYYDDGSPDPRTAISIAYQGERIVSVTGPGGNTTSFAYDASGEHLAFVTAPEVLFCSEAVPEGAPSHPVTAYQYELLSAGTVHFDALKSETGPSGNTIALSYQCIDQDKAKFCLSSIVSPDGAATFQSVQNNAAGITNRVTDTRGKVWEYEFTNRSASFGEHAFVFLDSRRTLLSTGEIVRWNYEVGSDNAVNMSKITDKDGNIFEYKYKNEDGSIDYSKWNDPYQEITYAAPGTPLVKTFGYDPVFHLMNKIVSPRGAETTYVLDAKGNRLEEHAPENKTMSFEYDSKGFQTKATDADGRVTESSRTYSPTGRTDITTVKGYNGELNIVKTNVFDLDGNLVSSTDANGKTTTYIYDAMNGLASITKPAVFDTETETTVSPVVEIRRDVNRQPIAKKNERGKWTFFKYDQMFRLIEKRIEMPGDDIITSFSYDAAGNKISQTDPNGASTTFSYDAANRLVSENVVVNGQDLSKTYEYMANSGIDILRSEGFLPTKITDRKGIVEEFTYDGAYRLVSKKRDGILLIENIYDASGNITKTTVHNTVNSADEAQITETTYDLLERPVVKTVKMGGEAACDLVTTTAYDKSGNIVQEVDPIGKTIQRFYDGAARLVSERVVIDGNNDPLVEYQYDSNGNKIKTIVHNETGSGNQETTVAYDAWNRPTSTTDAEGHAESYKYDLASNKTVAIDKKGASTLFTFDNANRLTSTSMPEVLDGETGGNVRPQLTQVYDKNGNVIQSTDARGLSTENNYDALNRLTVMTVKAEQDIVTEFSYDANSNKVSETFKRGDFDLVTSYEYDNFNRVTKVTDPEAHFEIYTYDTVGNKLSSTDKRGKTSNFEYDRANRLVKTIQPAVECLSEGNGTGEIVSPTTQTVYLKNGWVSQIIDARGNATQSFYDMAGRKIRVLDPAGGEIIFSYDKAGNAVHETVKDAGATGDRTRSFAFDKMNRQLVETLEPGTGLQRVYAYTYDPAGNKSSRTFPDGTVTNYSFDALGRLMSESYAGAEAQNRRYEYNLNGAATKATDASGVTQYAYDLPGRIVSETRKTPAGVQVSQITSTYDKAGNRLAATYPGGRVLSSTYDKRNLLKTLVDGGSTSVYGYDANGNRTSLALPNGIVTATAFDDANRVTSISQTSNGTELYSSQYFYDRNASRVKIVESRDGAIVRTSIYAYDQATRLIGENDGTTNIVYGFDDADNRISKTVNGVETSYQVDKLNRVLSATTGNDIVNYGYDLNGNRISKSGSGIQPVSYSYDRENRLISVQDAGGTVLFSATYDYRTRRLSCFENATETEYVYDGGDCVQERDSAGSLTKQLIRGTGLGGGIGSILYSETAGSAPEREYLLYNVIGSVVVTTNADASVKSTSLYEAFGKVIASTGASGNNRLFCSKERSESVGLDNFGHRYFDWELGRFISRDPSGYPDGINNQIYCGNNPINYIDPLGLSEEQAEKVRKFHEFYKKGRDAVQRATDLGNPGLKFTNEIINSMVDAGFKRTANSLQYGEDSYAKAAYEGAGSVAAENLPVVGSAERLYQGDRINDETGQLEKTSTGQKALDVIGLALDVASVIPGKGKLFTKVVDKLKDVPGANKLMGMADDALRAKNSTGYHATTEAASDSIMKGGFKPGTKPGRLGSGGTYVNDTVEGAVAEFNYHNPGVTPSVIQVDYTKGINAAAKTAPQNYVKEIPVNADTISAPSLRAPGTTNTNIVNGSATPIKIIEVKK